MRILYLMYVSLIVLIQGKVNMIKSFKGKAPILYQCFVAENATIIGNVTCYENVNVWYNAVIRGDDDSIIIKEGANIQDGVVIHCDEGYPVYIGKNCTIGHNAIIHGCTIHENTVVGMGATLLNGCVIGKNCIIGANALVSENKVIPDNSLVVGLPAKVIREVTSEQIISNQKNASLYIELANEQLERISK